MPESIIHPSPPIPAIASDPVALITTECITVTSAMRKNARWAQSSVASILGGSSSSSFLLSGPDGSSTPVTPKTAKSSASGKDKEDIAATNRWGLRGKKGKSIQDNPLIAAFSKLRADLASCKDITTFDTPSLLHPFLQVIRSSSISGPITSLALVAVTKFLSYNIFTTESPRIALAMQLLASAITHCRFEGSDSAHDEVVLLRILHLMDKMLHGPWGLMLADESVCEMMETGLSMCCQHRLSEVLRRSAEITMTSMCQIVFTRLRQLELEAPEDLEKLEETVEKQAEAAVPPGEVRQSNLAPTDSKPGEIGHKVSEEKISVSAPGAASVDFAGSDSASDFDIDVKPYSLPSIRELFRVLVELLDPHDKRHNDKMRIMALRMVDVALEVAGPSIARHPSLASLARDDLCRHLLQLIRSDSMNILQTALRVAGTLLATCRGVLKLQQELFLSYVVACLFPQIDIPREPGISPALYEGVPLGPKGAKSSSQAPSGRSTPVPVKERKKLGLEGGSRRPDAREAMVECVSSLARIPSFMTELFVNYDCDCDRMDLSEDIIGFLSRNAFPDSATWSTTNVPPLCLDALLGYVDFVASRLDDEPKTEGFPTPEKLRAERQRKQIIINGAKEFNESPKKGIAYFAKHGVIENIEDPVCIARFLRQTSRLNKKLLGEYISKKDNQAILDAFMGTFNFENKRVDEAIRGMLGSFRLPGEAQLIDRIVNSFSERYSKSAHDEAIASPDAVYVLTFAIIMLNTDQHNPSLKDQNRMKFEDFAKNLRGVNGGSDFSQDYLREIYNTIRSREIILPEEHDNKDAFEYAWKELLTKTDMAGDLIICDTNIYDADMFAATWKPIVATLSYVFMSATDDTVFSRVVTGFDQCARIAARYGLVECLDRIVSSLSMISTLASDKTPNTSLNTEVQISGNSVMVSELAVKFGRDFKAQLATVVLFRVVNGNENVLRDGWKPIIRSWLALFVNSLIPSYFSHTQTELDIPPIPLQPPTTVIERPQQASKDVGLFSTLSSYLSSYASDEPPEPSEEELECTLCTVDCINSCVMGDIFRNIIHLDLDSVEALLDALLEQLPEENEPLVILKPELPPQESNGYTSVTTDPGPKYDPSVIYVLEFATCIVLRDAASTERLGKKLAVVLQSVIRAASNAHYVVVSRTVYYLFSLLHASHDFGFLNTPVVLHLIANLDKQILTKSAESTIKGLKRCVTGPAPLKRQIINSPDFWGLLRNLLPVEDAAPEIFNVLKVILDEPNSNVTADNYEAVVSLLSDFATAGSVCAVWEQKEDKIAGKRGKTHHPTKPEDRPDYTIYKLSNQAIQALLGLSERVPSLISQSHLARPEAWTAYWIPLFTSLSHQCANPARHIRQSSFAALQRTLTSPSLQPPATPTAAATQIFQTVLFPLITHLLKPETYHSDPRGMSETRLQAATMLCRIFLHYLVLLPSWPEMLEIWVKIIDVLDRLINSGQGENLEVAVVECLKNAILVMSASGFLVAGSGDETKDELWKTTWGRIERLVPGLKKDLGLETPVVGSPAVEIQTSDAEPSVPASTTDGAADSGGGVQQEVRNEKVQVVTESLAVEAAEVGRAETPHMINVDPVTGSMV